MTSPVETAPLRPSGGRGRDRALPVAVLIAAFITLALAKPWEAVPQGRALEASRPSPGRAEAAPPESLTEDVTAPALSWDLVAKLAQPRDAWGVRAIVARPLGRSRALAVIHEVVGGGWAFSERWASVRLSASALASRAVSPYRSRVLAGVLSLDTAAATVAAVGITSPFSDTPLDVRIWRLRPGQLAERLPIRELPGEPPGVERLFLAPAPASPGDRAWDPGVYRLDVLLGSRLARVIVDLPGSPDLARDAPAPSRPALPPQAQAPAGRDGASAIERLRPGPFVVDAEAGPVHVPSAPGPALDEAASWLAGGGRLGPVASAAVREPLALGLRLRAGQQLVRAALTRLVPSPGLLDVPTRIDGTGGSVRGAGSDLRAVTAAFEAPSGSWPLGVYRIDAEWRESGRTQRASWHVDLLPRGGSSFAPFLAAARAVRSWAGRPALVATTAFRNGRTASALVQGGQAMPARQPPIRPPVRCVGSVIASPQRLLALGHDRLVAPEVVLAVVSRTGRRFAVPVAVAAEAAQGLVLVAPVSGGNLLPGTYELSLTYPGAPRGPDPVDRYLFCVRPTGVTIAPNAGAAGTTFVPGASRVRRR